MIGGYQKLIETVDKYLVDLGIDGADIELDHIGYKAFSKEDYFEKKAESVKEALLIHENEVSGRMVGIFKFEVPKIVGKHQLLAFEVVGPKEGEVCGSYWEHVEYVIKTGLDEFAKKYNRVNWDLGAINRELFPKVQIKFDDGTGAKFHTEDVLTEVTKMKADLVK